MLELINNVVLISSTQQSDLFMHIHVHISVSNSFSI